MMNSYSSQNDQDDTSSLTDKMHPSIVENISFRENAKHYIPMTDQEIDLIQKELGIQKLSDLFSHIPSEVRFDDFKLFDDLSYEKITEQMQGIAAKNNLKASFIGYGLKSYQTPHILSEIAKIRGLTTAYTPYQPERSQGTLIGLWLFSQTLSQLTGFEAINASLYDRATALYEALTCASRVMERNRVLVSSSFYEGDIEVLKTMVLETPLEIEWIPIDPLTGQTDLSFAQNLIQQDPARYACIAFPQVNSLGIIEDSNGLVDLCSQYEIKSIIEIDPMLIGEGGLETPAKLGRSKQGADIFVGEAQHLALPPIFGGPGLGIFGIQKASDARLLRQAPGRFVGKTKDMNGKEAYTLVLSTREQHIRREKATSNICSNQSFVANLVGASLLARGDQGLKNALETSLSFTHEFLNQVLTLDGVELAFRGFFANEVLLKLNRSAQELIQSALQYGLHIGVDVTSRVQQLLKQKNNSSYLILSFTDQNDLEQIGQLIQFFKSQFKKIKKEAHPHLNTFAHYQDKRKDSAQIPQWSEEKILKYYKKLGDQNVSPDQHIYALGSCTMKYNPYINDHMAQLKGFCFSHPMAPESENQGSLEVLYQIQEAFKSITGLDGVCTQAVAGAQGELVGLKMIQAYHRHHHPHQKRDKLLIPVSAHGTNPATATVAGFLPENILPVEANEQGQMQLSQIKEYLSQYPEQIAGIMVTNPNTSGIFESEFKQMAQKIHDAGALVYMDGANMNAIAGQINLKKLGVDAVHNNLHKTWSIPHGGGGPGDGMVAVSERLLDFIPGKLVRKLPSGKFETYKAAQSIGSFHRHMGNFGHKVRCLTYIYALGTPGVKKMSAVAVLSSRYLQKKVESLFGLLPKNKSVPRMHEFILSLKKSQFARLEEAGIPKGQIMGKLGKIFLDFGIHTPTVSFPETFGLMIEPTESFTLRELNQFISIIKAISLLILETPKVFTTAPHFTPVSKVDELNANKKLILSEKTFVKPTIHKSVISASKLLKMEVGEVCKLIIDHHKLALQQLH